MSVHKNTRTSRHITKHSSSMKYYDMSKTKNRDDKAYGEFKAIHTDYGRKNTKEETKDGIQEESVREENMRDLR